MAFVEARSPFLGDRVWSQPLDGETAGPDGARVDKRLTATTAPSRYRSRPRAATADGSEGPPPLASTSPVNHGSGPHSLRRRRSRRNSRSSRRQSSQGPPSITGVKQLPYVYLENCTQREFEIIMMISDILWERGDSPVGLLGTRLHAKTQDHNLPTHFKEAYGGLKKFVSRWPCLFVLHADHRYNPKVGLLGWPKSAIYGGRPPTGAPFSATNGVGQGSARARRRRANKTFQQAGARRAHGNFGSLPPGFSPYSQTQTLSRMYSPGGVPYQAPLDSLASHERSFTLPPTRDRAATYSGMAADRHHESVRAHAMSSFSPPSHYPHPDFARGLDGELLPARSHSPPREMVVEVGDPFDELEFEDYFFSGGRSHAASDPGPRPYGEPSPLHIPPSSLLGGYARRVRDTPRGLAPPLPGSRASRDNGSEAGSNAKAEDPKSVSPISHELTGSAGSEKQVLSKENSSAATSSSASPPKKSNDADFSTSNVLLPPPTTSNSTTPSNSTASRDRGISSGTTPGPSSHGRVATFAHDPATQSSASVSQHADFLRVRAMKMRAAAHHALAPEFAFVEEDNGFFGDFMATRVRSRSYDVGSRYDSGAPRPDELHLPASSPYYPHVSSHPSHDAHSLAPVPPLTPPYCSATSYPLSPRESASYRLIARERAMNHAHRASGDDVPYPQLTTPLAQQSGGAFFPRTQPLSRLGDATTLSFAPSGPSPVSKQPGFSLAKMMSTLSVDHDRAKPDTANGGPPSLSSKYFTHMPLDGMHGGRTRSFSSPAMPGNVLAGDVSGSNSTAPVRSQALLPEKATT